MNRALFRSVLTAVVVAIAVFSVTSTAQAGWRHWGYYGGYGGPALGWSGYNYGYYAGGWGAGCYDCGYARPAYVPAYTACYTPCYSSCYTPSYRGCGLLGRISYRWRTHHYGYYWGCNDPCWSFSNCCSVCGDVGTDCGCGAVGGDVFYDQPTVVPEGSADPTPAVPPTGDGQTDPVQEKQTLRQSKSAMLTVSVPSNARVLVNGVATRSTGDLRRYVSRNLNPGFSYTYEVTTEAVVDGQPVSQTKTVQLRAGDQTQLAFDMRGQEPVETALTIHVPSDAKVYLAGNETQGEGPVRTFRTTKLNGGKEWSQYAVRVTVVRDGEDLTKEETITLRAGDQTELTFDFEVDKLAAAR